MKLLVVGGGGREHAIIKSLKKNKDIEEIFALPGNGGIANDATSVNKVYGKNTIFRQATTGRHAQPTKNCLIFKNSVVILFCRTSKKRQFEVWKFGGESVLVWKTDTTI